MATQAVAGASTVWRNGVLTPLRAPRAAAPRRARRAGALKAVAAADGEVRVPMRVASARRRRRQAWGCDCAQPAWRGG